MPYILLFISITIIVITLLSNRLNKKEHGFSKLVDENMNQSNGIYNSLIERVDELENRIEEIETALLLLNDNLEKDIVTEIKEEKNDEVLELTKLNIQEVENDKVLEKMDDNKIKESTPKPINTKNTHNDKISSVIYKLSDAGKTVEEISSELRLGKGEVLLRLGLRKLK